jgi:hypothetical protein
LPTISASTSPSSTPSSRRTAEGSRFTRAAKSATSMPGTIVRSRARGNPPASSCVVMWDEIETMRS